MEKSTLDQLRIERNETPERTMPGWLKAVLLIIFIAAAAAAAWTFLKPMSLPEVKTAEVRQISSRMASTVLNASGYVNARRAATVSSKFTGKVQDVLIEEGMTVEEGQVMARLDDSNMRASYDLAAAQLESSRRSLRETEALLDEARINLERNQALAERSLTSVQDVDRSRALAISLDAQLNRKKADVNVAERQLDIYQKQLDDLVIRAPFSGVVVSKNAQPGEMISPVSAGGGFTRTGIGTIVDMSSLEIEIDVNESYIARVQPGQAVMATLDAYPDWNIPCHVIAIIPTADRQRATVEVRVGFDELDPRILPDMGVKVAFQEISGDAPASSAPSILLTKAALREQDGITYVLVYSEGVLERRAIRTGGERGNDVVVSSGLSAGEKVVTDGPENLADGDSVKERR